MESVPVRSEEDVDGSLIELFEDARRRDAQLVISGQPMIRYGADGNDAFYDECGMLKDATCNIRRISRDYEIDPVLNRRLGDKFLGVFTIAYVVEVETGDEFMLGLRALELGVQAQTIDLK